MLLGRQLACIMRIISSSAFFFLAAVVGGGAAGVAPPRPAILFATPSAGGSEAPPWANWVSLEYMKGLYNKSTADGGFEIDFTESLNDMTPARLQHYNALVMPMFVEPAALKELQEVSKEDVPDGGPAQMTNRTLQAFVPMVQNFVEQGGGIFMFPSEQNWATQWFPKLYALFGMTVPIETTQERNQDNCVSMNHMSSFTLAWTDVVTANHPVTDGVQAVWYPTTRMFNAAQTGPLLPIAGNNWQVLLRGTNTTQTLAVNLSAMDGTAMGPAPRCTNTSCAGRIPGVLAPALFAVRQCTARDCGAGRVAVLNQWREYTTASGSTWLFDDQVLAAGAQGRPSDMGRLLRNLFYWLAAPSLSAKDGGLGGYVTPASKLVSPNESPATIAKFAETTYDYDIEKLEGVDPADQTKHTYKGLIGAFTRNSEGVGTVAQFAAAATASKLDFVIFLEPFALKNNKTLTAAQLAKTKADCIVHSTPKLKLLPGYWMQNQFGSNIMFLGEMVELPPAVLITADGRRFLGNVVDPKDSRNTTGVLIPEAMSWLLTASSTGQPAQGPVTPGWNVGYFRLGKTAPVSAWKMYDLRMYSMAAVKYYDRSGTLVDNLVEDFLETAESTISPTPVCVSEVASPALLTAAIKANQALTHVRSTSVATIFTDALRWFDNFIQLPSFVSNGPTIESWPFVSRGDSTRDDSTRGFVLGCERFVVGQSLQLANISVSARTGGPDIKEVAIFNGRELFRRFEVNGPHLFRTLVLDANLHKTLVIVVTDTEGGTALGNSLSSYKPGSNAVVFCGDHTNDCGVSGHLHLPLPSSHAATR
jgi:hypothetical protein